MGIMNFQNLFNNLFHDAKNERDEDYDNKIATSVLFLELAYADFMVTEEEEKNIYANLKKFFNLPQNEVEEVINVAKEKRDSSNDIWIFTNQIKHSFSRERKNKIIELLWQLVYSDGKMDKYEEALMRKISNLLGLTHGEMIQAKNKVKPG
jgi:uncharacterized tellurite resistance protein B-like protein